MLEESDAATGRLALDGSASVIESDPVALLDQLPDTKDGQFNLHVLESYLEVVAINFAMHSASSAIVNLLSTSGGGKVARLRLACGMHLVLERGKVLGNVCSING